MHLSTYLWRLRIFARRLWVRITLVSLLAVVCAGLASVTGPYLPFEFSQQIDRDAAMRLLQILTNSMLTVTTFSLSVMVAAHHYASSLVTPRSHRLLRADGRTQTVLATFIGAFIYAVMSIVLVTAGLYTGAAYTVLYFFTIFVILMVIGAIIRWTQHLSGLGSMEQTTQRVETAAAAALRRRMDAPCLGGTPIRPGASVPDAAASIPSARYGYVQFVDMAALQEIAEQDDRQIHLGVLPGDWINPGDPLLRLTTWGISAEREADLRGCITLNDTRDFDQDPEFGIQVMSEIAQRALSPGLNDPRTATDVILRQLRLLQYWRDETEADASVAYPRIHARAMTAESIVIEAFDRIARDGAHLLEVQQRIQTTLATLARHDSPSMREAARHVSQRALAYSDDGLTLASDRAHVRGIAPAGAPQAA